MQPKTFKMAQAIKSKDDPNIDLSQVQFIAGYLEKPSIRIDLSTGKTLYFEYSDLTDYKLDYKSLIISYLRYRDENPHKNRKIRQDKSYSPWLKHSKP